MRLPLSWLRDFVDYSGTPEELADRLGTSGFEIEGILRPGAPKEGGNHANFVIGRVEHFEKHPNADRLRLCRVDTGDEELRQIVCGASNFAIGDTVVVATPGSVLPGADAPLKQAKLRGEVSNGMMLSERELGLSDEHDGIIILPADAGYEVGSRLADHVELDEVVLDISVESNRGDCLSVYGMAREVAVLFDLPLAPMPGTEPAATGGSTSDLVTVAIDAPERCSRFTARGFTNVTIGPSPFRIRQRLAAAGIRPISNVVDVTNYVMHELGNPLHVYDADKIPGKALTARLARDGETITTLDDKERVLTNDMLVIADADGPSGIAGVMGGAASEIKDGTTKVMLEVACFERGGIQRTSKALGLRTDGSNRWEKGVSPHLAPLASVRAAQLIVEWSGAKMLGDPQDVIADLPDDQTVALRKQRPVEVLGMHVQDAEVKRILDGLGYAPADTGEAWSCTVPFWRWLDATREIDLVEEIGRVHGLKHVPVELPRVPPGIGGLTREQQIRRRIEDHLAGVGLREVSTISLVDPDVRAAYHLDGADSIVLRNPLSADLSELRTSLIPSLIEVVRRNRSVGERDVQIFEIGRSYRPGGDGGLAIEESKLGIAIAGHLGGEGWTGAGAPADFSTLVGIVDGLLARLGVDATRVAETAVAQLHPGRAAALVAGSVRFGVIGELHPGPAVDLDLDGPVSMAEIDLAALTAAVPGISSFEDLSSFPPVRQDIAVIVDDSVEAATLLTAARDAGGDLLREVDVFDVFSDAERVGAGKVSVALRLVFQADDRTLTDEDATAAREQIVAALVGGLGAELRG
ncbi:MAG: phenylalanine--tRNA ligase subunit beta [Thermoleophilia bacterium]